MLGNTIKKLSLNDKVPTFYKHIYTKLVKKDCKQLEKLTNNNKIEKKDIRKFLCSHAIPLELHHAFLKEMELYGLIKINDRLSIELIDHSIYK